MSSNYSYFLREKEGLFTFTHGILCESQLYAFLKDPLNDSIAPPAISLQLLVNNGKSKIYYG
jgi:hypothetical protein